MNKNLISSRRVKTKFTSSFALSIYITTD